MLMPGLIFSGSCDGSVRADCAGSIPCATDNVSDAADLTTSPIITVRCSARGGSMSKSARARPWGRRSSTASPAYHFAYQALRSRRGVDDRCHQPSPDEPLIRTPVMLATPD